MVMVPASGQRRPRNPLPSCAHHRFHDLIQDLFSGTQKYTGLKSRLLRNLNGTLFEVVMNFFFGKLIPEQTRV